MSEEPAKQSHFMGWTLSIVAVPVLYILSYGPVVYLINRGTIPHPLPKVLVGFYKPWVWLYHDTSLRNPLGTYIYWWINAARAASKPLAPPPSPSP